jgi:hypothetical protein
MDYEWIDTALEIRTFINIGRECFGFIIDHHSSENGIVLMRWGRERIAPATL